MTADDLMTMIAEFVQKWEDAEVAWYAKMNTEYLAWHQSQEPRKAPYPKGDSPDDRYNKFFLERGVKDGSTRVEIQMWHYSEKTRDAVTKRLRKEARTRIESLQQKIAKKAGDIIAVENLRWNGNGGFDGTVVGTLRTVYVETILAGGHNIQRLHYRTLVK